MIFNKKILLSLAGSAITTVGIASLFAITSCNNNAGGTASHGVKSDNTKLSVQEIQWNEKFKNNKLWQKYLATQMNNSVKSTQTDIPVILAQAFDSRTGIGKSFSCMLDADNPNNIKFSNPTSQASVFVSASASDISDMLNTGIDGKFNFGRVEASANSKYIQNIMDTSRSLGFNYWFAFSGDMTFGLKGKLGNNALSEDARDILIHGGGLSAFLATCADSYVDNAKVGGLLLFSAKILFNSHSDLEQATTQMGVRDIALGHLKGYLDKVHQDIRQNMTIQIHAYQVGGDFRQLGKIFAAKDVHGNYAVTSCSLDDWDSCAHIIDAAISYAAEELPKQIDIHNQETLYVYSPHVMKYRDIGIQAELNPLTPEEQNARNDIIANINHDKAMLSYLQAYQKQPFIPNVTYTTQQLLIKTIASYQDMIQEYDNYDLISSCYGDIMRLHDRCLYADQEVKDLHTKYKKFIDFANQISGTIVAFNDSQSVFVVANDGSGCYQNSGDNLTQCTGTFVRFSLFTHKFDKDDFCIVDTSIDNSFFKTNYPSLLGKMYSCYRTSHYYARRVKDNNPLYGISGQYIDNREVDDNVNQSGFNTIFLYSDSSDFLYNPI